MKRLELIKGLSYTMRGFSCSKGKPFEVEDELGEQLMATGRFEESVPEEDGSEVEDEESADDEEVTQGEPAKVEDELTAAKVAAMKNADLIALAEQKNISLEGCGKHDEYVERINGALGLVDFSQLGLE